MKNLLRKYYMYAVKKRLLYELLKKFHIKRGELLKEWDLKIAHWAWKRLSKKTRVINNQIMFKTYQNNYTCNPKYFCRYLLKTNAKVKIIWVYSKKTKKSAHFPKDERVKLVRYGSYEYYKAMAQSKYWIDNAHGFLWENFPKKDEQVLINLWHGSLGLKKIDPDSDSNERRRAAGELAKTKTDYCLINSDFEEMVFRTSYWPTNPLLKYGHPRNDVFFFSDATKEKLKLRVCKKYNIDPDKHLFLYAPTFRDNTDSIEYFDVDYERLKAALEKRFGGEWLILSRFHFHTVRALQNQKIELPDFVIDANDYADIQILQVASDIGMTDYSSWICDFVLSGKPGFLFTTDIDSYVTERGFYYPLDDTPFPIARNNDELIENILNFDPEKYEAKRVEFLDKLGCVEDGNASRRLTRFILDDIKKNKKKK